jgi:hypothetical protein
VVRVDAVGDIAEPRFERESRCLPLPRVAFGNLGRSSCDSLHRSGLRVLLPPPMRASSSKQAPRDLKPTAEGGDWSPQEMQSNLRPPVACVKRALRECQGVQWLGDSPANSYRPAIRNGHPGSLRGPGDWFDSYEPHQPSLTLASERVS